MTYSFTFTYCHGLGLNITKLKDHLFQIMLVRLLDNGSTAACQEQLLWLLDYSEVSFSVLGRIREYQEEGRKYLFVESLDTKGPAILTRVYFKTPYFKLNSPREST